MTWLHDGHGEERAGAAKRKQRRVRKGMYPSNSSSKVETGFTAGMPSRLEGVRSSSESDRMRRSSRCPHVTKYRPLKTTVAPSRLHNIHPYTFQ